jgi:hypothetical protein
MADKVIIEAEVKSNIGDVSKGVDKAADSTKKLVKETDNLEKSTKKGAKGFKGIGKAVRGVGTALKAAGIGIIAALLAKMMQVLGNNQKVLDKFNTTMNALTIIFGDLFTVIGNNVGKWTGWFGTLFTDPLTAVKKLRLALKNLGVDIKNFFTGGAQEYFKEVLETSELLTELEKKARAAAVEFALLNAKFLKSAEQQRQIRDDVSKTFAERIEANKKLGKILTEQQAAQRASLQKQVASAKALHKQDETNLDNKIAYKETLVAQAELEEAITGQRSEQLTNQVALEEELRDAKAQTLAEGMTGMERELQELEASYQEKIRLADKAGMKTLAITKQYEKQKQAIVLEGVATLMDAYAALSGALSQAAGDNKALAIAEAVIATWSAATKALVGPVPLNFINMAAVVAAGFANIQKIMAVDVGSGGSGGTGAISSTTPAPPAPEMMSGAFTLSGGFKPDPLQAYVVSDDITNNQDKLAIIRRRATI